MQDAVLDPSAQPRDEAEEMLSEKSPMMVRCDAALHQSVSLTTWWYSSAIDGFVHTDFVVDPLRMIP